MKTRARFFMLILAVTLLTLVSACKQNKSLSAYYDENNNNFSGSGDNNNDCGGCCGGCDDEEPITCDSVISIVDKQGLPVENATVTVYSSRTRIFFTDDNGEASVTGFSDGEYVIKVEAEGFNDKVTLITVADNVCPNIEVLLVAEPVEPVLPVGP